MESSPSGQSHSLSSASRASGLSIDVLKAAARRGDLRIVQVGTRPLIFHDDLTTFVNNLPAYSLNESA